MRGENGSQIQNYFENSGILHRRSRESGFDPMYANCSQTGTGNGRRWGW